MTEKVGDWRIGLFGLFGFYGFQAFLVHEPLLWFYFGFFGVLS
jgi:hypothetical protein